MFLCYLNSASSENMAHNCLLVPFGTDFFSLHCKYWWNICVVRIRKMIIYLFASIVISRYFILNILLISSLKFFWYSQAGCLHLDWLYYSLKGDKKGNIIMLVKHNWDPNPIHYYRVKETHKIHQNNKRPTHCSIRESICHNSCLQFPFYSTHCH